MSIDYAFRPYLRSRLTLGGITFPRKPWVFGEQDSHLFNRYSSPHIHLLVLHLPLLDGFAALTTLSYRVLRRPQLRLSAYSRSLSAPSSSSSELLRTL